MRKLGNLVINEYVKFLMKKSTIIMLISIILVAAGYNGIKLLQDRENRNYMGYNFYQSYDDQINWLKSDKYEGWELNVEILTYLRDNNIAQNYYDDDYWIHSAAYTMFEQMAKSKELIEAGKTVQGEKAQKIAEDLKKAIEEKDWSIYNKTVVDTIEARIAEHEEETDIYYSKEYYEMDLWVAKYQLEHDIPPYFSNWRHNLLEEVRVAKHELANLKSEESGQQDRKKIALAEENVLMGEYRLENGIKVCTTKSAGVIEGISEQWGRQMNMWDAFIGSALGIQIISVLIIIVAGSVIASEFSSGTIKYLLVNPVKRYKIFLSKYISVLTFAFLMLFIYYIINLLLSGIFFGFNLSAPYLYVTDGKVMEGSSLWFVASKYLLGSVGMICMATLAFAVSSVARSSALSIGLGVFLYLSGYSVVAILRGLNLDFGRYIIFSNLELNVLAEGKGLYRGQTLSFAIGIICVYMVVFLLTAWDGFVRRDVK